MICVEVGDGGFLKAAPVGGPECEYILVSQAEASYSELTVEQGAQISFAVIMIWAIAYGFRALARVSNDVSDKEF